MCLTKQRLLDMLKLSSVNEITYDYMLFLSDFFSGLSRLTSGAVTVPAAPADTAATRVTQARRQVMENTP